ncbi:hypothetical protein IAE39_003950 [Pseudomonas sp. S37]|uniref:hypothetical protein n=1 Tax=Pseudomonas sp. S37 TaxID=2767449 RepID=UPI0019137360|nr:hypothetical protein [Pseudomonas sp. S37]MBK4995776.1 hypothetical protein [Pseudomonas sp. S37]
MTNEDFLSHIDTHVKEATVSDLIQIFTSPPGRNPDKTLKAIAAWRSSLLEEDVEMINTIIEETVTATLFSLFAVLDGSRTIDKDIEKFIISTKDMQGNILPITNSEFDLHSHFAPD